MRPTRRSTGSGRRSTGPGQQSTGPEAGLREAWRRRSLAAGWTHPDDWWAPAVDTVTAAVRAETGLAGPLRMLGESRGRAGAGIAETLDDLGALLDVIGRTGAPLELVKPVAEGWAGAGLVSLTHATCEDPLTGLVTMPYLRTRLGELYREARRDGTCPADTHRLLLIAPEAGSGAWQRLARMIVIGHDLRMAFPGSETLSLAGRNRLIVLTRASPEPGLAAAGLRRRLAGTHGARARVFREGTTSMTPSAPCVLMRGGTRRRRSWRARSPHDRDAKGQLPVSWRRAP